MIIQLINAIVDEARSDIERRDLETASIRLLGASKVSYWRSEALLRKAEEIKGRLEGYENARSNNN